MFHRDKEGMWDWYHHMSERAQEFGDWVAKKPITRIPGVSMVMLGTLMTVGISLNRPENDYRVITEIESEIPSLRNKLDSLVAALPCDVSSYDSQLRLMSLGNRLDNLEATINQGLASRTNNFFVSRDLRRSVENQFSYIKGFSSNETFDFPDLRAATDYSRAYLWLSLPQCSFVPKNKEAYMADSTNP